MFLKKNGLYLFGLCFIFFNMNEDVNHISSILIDDIHALIDSCLHLFSCFSILICHALFYL
jgi:hypothetical protein